MGLTEEECFALRKLFHGDSRFDVAVIDQLNGAEVIERKETRVGFFSTIRFPIDLPDSQGQVQWDWNFDHQNLKYGGSFIGCYESPNIIKIEAVVHDGEWPTPFYPEAFSSSE